MPIYEYACGECGKEFEELIVRKQDEADLACPGCRSVNVSRQMSRPAAVRTGGGGGGGFAAAPSCGPVG
jgi:putative FmdB family regulatory protein